MTKSSSGTIINSFINSPVSKFLLCCLFLPGRCLPAGDRGCQGSLCPQFCTPSTAAGSLTSSPWRRTSRGQTSCRSVAEKTSTVFERFRKTIFCRNTFWQVYIIQSMHLRKDKTSGLDAENEKHLQPDFLTHTRRDG